MSRLSRAFMLLCFSCSGGNSSKQSRYVVEEGPLRYRSAWQGEFVARHGTTIFAPDVAASYLTVSSLLDDGSPVNKGDVVLRFDRTIVQQEVTLEKAKAEIERAVLARTLEELHMQGITLKGDRDKKAIELKQAELKLAMSGTMISRMEKERIELDIKKFKGELAALQQSLTTFNQQKAASIKIAELKVASVDAEVRRKEEQLIAMDVLAPESGVLYGPYTRLNFQFGKVAVGSVVRPGDKILEIPDVSHYDMVVYLRQKDATYLTIGDDVQVYPSIAPDSALKARVVEKGKFAISQNERLSIDVPQGNFKEIQYKLSVEESPAAIRPGNTARVEIDLLRKEKCLLVPLIYVQYEGPQSYVTKANGGKVFITLGLTTSSHGEVLSGIEKGDILIR